MRLLLPSLLLVTACATGAAASAPAESESREQESSETLPLPGKSGFDADEPQDAAGSTSSSSSSSGGSTSSGASGSTSSSSGGSSSSSGSNSSSSGASTSSSSSSSGGGGGACGVCDRPWTCNGFTDLWSTNGAVCVNTRTTTALKCNGKFDQGGSVSVGTWSYTGTTLKLVYPMLGGGTKTYECF